MPIYKANNLRNAAKQANSVRKSVTELLHSNSPCVSLKRNDEPIADFAMEMRDTLYQAWPELPRDQLEDLLNDY